ncbi:hypothetical protein [Haloferula sp. BvORR071]|uniref:hypothetical protein n=1 Tax=Haloferula sp. BvORR071 TaxID=1396141 RepID=UPI000550B933|nr:hypothetical protein [Haloferula sp. BvORR071]
MNGNEELGPPKRSSAQRWLRWIGGPVLFLGLCFLLALMGNAVPFLFVSHMGIGWWWHAENVLPPLLPQWPALLLPLACLGIAIPVGHRFMLWLVASRERATIWRLPQTLCVIALLLLASAAAIAMSGITHQLAWLLSTQSIDSTGPRSSSSKVRDATRDLLDGVLEFKTSKGRYPETLAEVEEAFPKLRGCSRIAPSAGRPLEPFIYLKPGSHEVTENYVLLVSPGRPGLGGMVVVGFASGSVSMQPASKVQDLMEGEVEP